jgi:hypothetical protein
LQREQRWLHSVLRSTSLCRQTAARQRSRPTEHVRNSLSTTADNRNGPAAGRRGSGGPRPGWREVWLTEVWLTTSEFLQLAHRAPSAQRRTAQRAARSTVSTATTTATRHAPPRLPAPGFWFWFPSPALRLQLQQPAAAAAANNHKRRNGSRQAAPVASGAPAANQSRIPRDSALQNPARMPGRPLQGPGPGGPMWPPCAPISSRSGHRIVYLAPAPRLASVAASEQPPAVPKRRRQRKVFYGKKTRRRRWAPR